MTTTKCTRCDGTGTVPTHHMAGVCFRCNGDGAWVVSSAAEKAAAVAREVATRREEVAHAKANVEKASAGWARRSAEANLARAEKMLAFWLAQ
jgi:hypothetical protein